MKRYVLLFSLLGAFALGCKGESKKDDAANNTPAPGAEQNPGGAVDGVTPEEQAMNPVDGVEPAAAILEAGQFTDGPVWHAGLGVLFFSTPLGEGALYRMLPDGRVIKLRDGNKAQGTTPIGSTVNGNGELITVEAKQVVRGPADGAPGVVASGFPEGAFDTLNDVVSRKDGTMYVTDPGYFADTIAANRIYRIDPAGNVQVIEAFEDVPRPNGIALSPDEKTLFVGFSAPTTGTLPFVRKYTVNDDGTLGEWTKFIDIGPIDSQPDGLAVDKVGNLYVATNAGVEVFSPSGTPFGTIPVPEKPTGMTFGGAEMKTLYITTAGVKIWQINMKLAGVAQ